MSNSILRILIIEDNIDHIELLSQVIERYFAPVDLHTVENIEDAFDFIDQTEYHIVLTDCFINGESIVEQIPNLRKKLSGVPIVVITGSGDENLAAEVIKRGANDYLVKTRNSIEKIPELINKYIKNKEKPKTRLMSKKRGLSPIKEQIIDEVSTLNKKARHMASYNSNKTPDVKQLESLIEQIKHLKDLASKLKDR